MTVELVLFYLFGSVAVGTGLGMILQRNALLSALLLVGNFFCIAALYLLLQQQFLAVIQIVVYTGAIMVLVVFVIMLLNLAEDHPRPKKNSMQYSIAVALVIGFLVELVYILMFTDRAPAGFHPEAGKLGTVESIGDALFNKFMLPFEVASVLLLVAVVGAVLLAKKRLP